MAGKLIKIDGMSPNEYQFVHYLLADPNMDQTAAYMKTFPDATNKTAKAAASRMMKRHHVQRYLDQAIKDRQMRMQVNEDYVIAGLVRVYERCMEDEPVMRDGEQTGQYQFNAAGALKALELLGKHQKMFSDKDTGNSGATFNFQIDLGSRLREVEGKILEHE